MTKKTMYEKTLKALDGSIKKWKMILAGEGPDKGDYNCPLCQLFKGDCEKCPINTNSCMKTPYVYFVTHMSDYHDDSDWIIKGCKECERLAKAELDFIISTKKKFIKNY